MRYIIAIIMGCTIGGLYILYENGLLISKSKKQPSGETLGDFLEIPFFRLPLLRISLIKNGDIQGYFQIHLEMEAASKKSYDEARIFLPKIIDAIVLDLHGSLPYRWTSLISPPPETIKARALYVANTVVGEKKICRVFIRDMAVEWK